MGLPGSYCSLAMCCDNCTHAGEERLNGNPVLICWFGIDDEGESITDKLVEVQAVKRDGSCDHFEWSDKAASEAEQQRDERRRR